MRGGALAIFGALLWKEWHEQKWRLVSLAAILLSLEAFVMVRQDEVAVVPVMLFLFAVHALFGSIFIAMAAAAGERARGTLNLVRALPVRPAWIMAAKLAIGAATCAVPPLLSTAFLAVWAAAAAPNLRDTLGSVTENLPAHEAVLCVGLLASAVSVTVFLWATAAGVGQPTELRAGLAGLLVVFAWLLLALVAPTIGQAIDPAHPAVAGSVARITMGPGPFGPLLLLAGEADAAERAPGPPSLLAVVAVQLAALAPVVLWTLLRFARLRRDEGSPGAAAGPSAPPALLRPRRGGRATALAWMQVREMTPLLITGVVVMVAIVAVALTSELTWPYGPPGAPPPLLDIAWGVLGTVTTPVGFILALVVGVASFAPDLEPRLLAFWRSRPIRPSGWFWTKYAVGAAVLLTAVDGPPVILRILAGRAGELPGDAYLGCIPLLHLLVYSIAAFFVCWVRHAVYAGILALGVALAFVIVPLIEPSLEFLDMARVMHALDAVRLDGAARWLSGGYLIWLAVAGAITIAAAGGAYGLVRSDAALERAGRR